MTRSALAIAHPSHELRMYGWLEREQPVVYILTDGGGRAQQPRLAQTAALLDQLGSPPGAVFGRLTDLALYDAILAGDVGLFSAIVEELAADLIARDVGVVVGDAAEGYSSAHDVWRVMVDAAVAIVRRAGREIENFEFSVIAAPDSGEGTHVVTLDDGEFARKLDAVRAYSPTLAADVDAAMAGEKFYGIRRFSEPEGADAPLMAETIQRFTSDERDRNRFSALMGDVDIEAFRQERFWRRDAAAPLSAVTTPFYEAYGEELVRAGRYQRVIRFEEHIRPIAEALGRRRVPSVGAGS